MSVITAATIGEALPLGRAFIFCDLHDTVTLPSQVRSRRCGEAKNFPEATGKNRGRMPQSPTQSHAPSHSASGLGKELPRLFASHTAEGQSVPSAPGSRMDQGREAKLGRVGGPQSRARRECGRRKGRRPRWPTTSKHPRAPPVWVACGCARCAPGTALPDSPTRGRNTVPVLCHCQGPQSRDSLRKAIGRVDRPITGPRRMVWDVGHRAGPRGATPP